MREILIENQDLARKLEALEKSYDEQFKIVFDALRRLLDEPGPSNNDIGFKVS